MSFGFRRLLFGCTLLLNNFYPSIAFPDTFVGTQKLSIYWFTSYFSRHDIRTSNLIDGSWMRFEVESESEYPVKLRLKSIATCKSGRLSTKTEEKIIRGGETLRFSGKYCSGRGNDYAVKIRPKILKETVYKPNVVNKNNEFERKVTHIYDWYENKFTILYRYRVNNIHETPREYFVDVQIKSCFKEGSSKGNIEVKLGRVEPGASTTREVTVCQYDGHYPREPVSSISSQLRTGDLGKLPPLLFYGLNKESETGGRDETATPQTRPQSTPYEIHLVNKCKRSIDFAIVYQDSRTGVWSHVNNRVTLNEIAPNAKFVVKTASDRGPAMAIGSIYYVWYRFSRGNTQFKGKYPYFIHATGRTQFFNKVTAAPAKNNSKNVDITPIRC